jgi:hypothetical protein
MFKRLIDYNYQHLASGLAKVSVTKIEPKKVAATVATFYRKTELQPSMFLKNNALIIIFY